MPKLEIKLYELMARKNIRTIEDLKELSGVSRKAISKAINGNSSRMDFDTVVKLCKALDCEIGELLVVRKEDENAKVEG